MSEEKPPTALEAQIEEIDDGGIFLHCPKCNTADAVIYCRLSCPSNFRCEDCGEDFTLVEVDRLIKSAREWEEMIKYLRGMRAINEKLNPEVK